MTTQLAVDEVPLDDFPMRLVIARQHAGRLSAKAAALRVGVTGTTWNNWEQGVHLQGALKPSMLRYIAGQLGVSETWLRDGGPLRAADDAGPDGGGRARGDSNSQPADWLDPPLLMAA